MKSPIMSTTFPIIAITGSAGSGISTSSKVFEKIFRQLDINAEFVHGNSFRRFPRKQLTEIFSQAEKTGQFISHFGPEVTLLNRLEGLFREFARSGTGCVREYIESDEQAATYQQEKGEFSPWVEIPNDTQLLFYEGQHGGCVEASWSKRIKDSKTASFTIQKRVKSQAHRDDGVDIAQWVDLLIGIVPNINLEWIQKINRSCGITGCSTEDAVNIILRRMPEYINYMTPQFSLTDINFQRIPLVDTSNPFIAKELPTEGECMIIVRFREPQKHDIQSFKNKFPDSFLSRPNTLVLPNSYMEQAMETICSPIVNKFFE